METPVNARTIQFVARLIAIALLVLIALAIHGLPSSHAAGVAPAITAPELTLHEAFDGVWADAAPIEPGASVAAYER